MTDPEAGRRGQLIIWAAAEARRLRHEPVSVDATVAHPAAMEAADVGVERILPVDARGPVVDWQLPIEATHERSAW